MRLGGPGLLGRTALCHTSGRAGPRGPRLGDGFRSRIAQKLRLLPYSVGGSLSTFIEPKALGGVQPPAQRLHTRIAIGCAFGSTNAPSCSAGNGNGERGAAQGGARHARDTATPSAGRCVRNATRQVLVDVRAVRPGARNGLRQCRTTRWGTYNQRPHRIRGALHVRQKMEGTKPDECKWNANLFLRFFLGVFTRYEWQRDKPPTGQPRRARRHASQTLLHTYISRHGVPGVPGVPATALPESP